MKNTDAEFGVKAFGEVCLTVDGCDCESGHCSENQEDLLTGACSGKPIESNLDATVIMRSKTRELLSLRLRYGGTDIGAHV